jgi:hypothetical protein
MTTTKRANDDSVNSGLERAANDLAVVIEPGTD